MSNFHVEKNTEVSFNRSMF